MDLSPENLKQQMLDKKLADLRVDLIPLLEKHRANIRGTLTPINAQTAEGGKELVFRTGTEIIFTEDEVEETKEEPKPKEKK